MKAFLRNMSLQIKFILITTIVVSILMVILGTVITRRERNLMYSSIERQGRVLAETLAIPVMSDISTKMLYKRLGLIEEGKVIGKYFLEIFEKKDMDLEYLIVLDENGTVIAHNDRNEYGKIYQNPITVNALASDTTIVQQFYNRERGHDALDIATPLTLGRKRWGTLKFAVCLAPVAKSVQATALGVMFFGLLLLAGSFVIIVLLSRRFIRPIAELAETMGSAGGDMLDVNVPIRGEDEIASLGKSFNSMVERIREVNRERRETHEKLLGIARTMESIGGDLLDVKIEMKGENEIALLGRSFNSMIDRIRESNLELKETHERLLQSQKLASLGIFASGVAHEINNPLGGMFNCVDMLKQRGADESFRLKYLDLIRDGLSRIETTVGKLLSTARKEEKNLELIHIRQSIQNFYGFIDYQLKMKNIIYSENIADEAALMMDPHDFQHVIMNLMLNAIHSMENGGSLSVNAWKENSHVLLEVADSGEGIAEENLDKIFDPFYSTKSSGEGTGLGLWVTYEIVKDYGGDISVRSREGEGSIFTIKLDSTG